MSTANAYEIERQRQSCWAKIDAAEKALEPLRVQVQAWEYKVRQALDELDGLNATHGPQLSFEQLREARQDQVLKLVAAGNSQAEIAEELSVSEAVIRCDLRILDVKAGGKTNAQAK